jgi:hypothetical protein
MGRLLCFAIGAMLIQSHASAQTAGVDGSAVDVASPDNKPTASTAGTTTPATIEYVPMTASERARKYILGAFGPGAILRAAASAGISQGTVTPKEWGVGPEAYGDRFGNAFAKHVVREALEYGMSAALHEDNRYFRSTESGFFKRSKHAVASVFVARNEAGGEHFAVSRFGSVLGSSFISRLWQPRSEDGSGDAAVSFGLTMVSDIGFNFFHEFCPRGLTKHFRIH